MSNQRLVPLNVAALASAPAGVPKIGDLYYNTTNLKTWVYSSGGWVVAAGGGAAFQTSAPTGPQVGDIWVDSDAAINLLTPDDYALLSGPTFTGPSTVAVNSASTALTIKQTGAGNALVVEDSTSPDSTPFVINASGNVGVGTASPTAKLAIRSDRAATSYPVTIDTTNGATFENTLFLQFDGSASNIGNFQNFPLALITNNTERLRITSAGNVGIGTSSPAKLLDVNGDALINGLTVGKGAGAVSSNTAVGASALAANTTGYWNTGIGYTALAANTTGASNTSIGLNALSQNTTGVNNTSVGRSSLGLNTTGESNSAFGVEALLSNTAATQNTAMGMNALRATTTGSGNTAIGMHSMLSNTTGYLNTAVGTQALYYNTTGFQNTAVGVNALLNNTASNNTGVGFEALFTNTSGVQNTSVGFRALRANTTGFQNTAVGEEALKSNTTAYECTAVGQGALTNNTTGNQNTGLGQASLATNTTGTNNVAVGQAAMLLNTTGGSNVAVGLNAMYSNTTGGSNTAVGVGSLNSNTTSNNNGFGYNALTNTTTGYDNVGMGDSTLGSNTSGLANTAVGSKAGYGVGTNSNTTGLNNTFIGYAAVGASATANNVITLGNSSIATLRCQVTTITALSDARDKTNIEAIPAGLDFVNRLSPVAFDWNARDGAKVGIPDMGFIAQDLLKVMEDTGIEVPNLVSQENPDRLEAGYGTLIPVLVQAIKELSEQVKQLQGAAHA